MKRRGTRVELGAALAAALALGGCGSGNKHAAPPPPRLPAALAARLAARSDEVARLLESNDGCGALAAANELKSAVIAAVNARRVPARFQEPLLGAANDLTGRITCSPPPHEEHKGKSKGHGKGKGGHDGGEG